MNYLNISSSIFLRFFPIFSCFYLKKITQIYEILP